MTQGQPGDYTPPPPPQQQQPAYDPTVPPGPPPPQAAVPMGYETPAGAAVEMNKEARTWGMVAHLSSLAGLVIPLGNFIGPLVVWLVKKDEMPFVNDQGKESLNFQITVTIAAVIAAATICIGIGLILLPVVAVVAIVFAIIAGIKANEGIPYRYPFTLRLLK